MADASQGVDFRSAAARNRTSQVYSVPAVLGSRVSIQQHNDGYLAELMLNPNWTLSVTSGTVTDAAQAASNHFPFIGIKNPDGDYIWSTNSRDLFDFCYRLYYGQVISSQPGYAAINFGSTSSQSLNYWLKVPVSMNDGFNFDTGLLMRQLSNVFFFLELAHCAVSDLVGSGTATFTITSGTTGVSEVTYDAVDPNSNPPVAPPSFAEYVQYRSLQSGPLQNGSNDLSYAIGPVLTDVFLRLINNGAADGTLANLTYVDVKINQRQVIDHRTGAQLAVDQFVMTGNTYRAGVYHENYYDDRDSLNTTMGRDFINSEKGAQLDHFVQYGGTPSGTSFVGQFFRELVGAA